MLLDIIVIAAFIIFGVLGYSRGFIKSALSLIRMSTSVVIAIIVSRPIASFLNNTFDLAKTCAWAFKTTQSNGGLILIAIVALVVFLAIPFFMRFINRLAKKAKEKSKIARHADSWLGAVMGVIQFSFFFCILSAIVFIVTIVPFFKGLHDWLFGDSVVASWLYGLATDLIFQKILGAVSSAIGL